MKKDDLKILKFPSASSKLERQVEAILFAAEEPLDEESIQEKLKTRTNIAKISEKYPNCFFQLFYINEFGEDEGNKMDGGVVLVELICVLLK